MSSDQPYNELGQILANGGEIALGLAISRGWSGSQIALLFARRFDPMAPGDRERLIELAERAVSAASSINELGDDDPIDIDSIPENPFLFGNDPAGRRGKVAYRFTIDEGATWFDGRINVADISNKAAMFNQAEGDIRDNWGRYPEGGRTGFGKGEMEHLTIELVFTERRF